MATPEQIQAAMPAMREWTRGDLLVAACDELRWGDEAITPYVEHWYPGGVVQFIKDQEEARCSR